MSVILGYLFAPAAYLTATRQAVAHRTKASLDELHLELKVNESGVAQDGFMLEGLKLEGARWARGGSTSRVCLNDGSTVSLETCCLVWQLQDSTSSATTAKGTIPVTVYLDVDRSQSLFTTRLPAEAGLTAAKTAQRAVAMRAA